MSWRTCSRSGWSVIRKLARSQSQAPIPKISRPRRRLRVELLLPEERVEGRPYCAADLPRYVGVRILLDLGKPRVRESLGDLEHVRVEGEPDDGRLHHHRIAVPATVEGRH